ncbi:MAG TPA: ABC transporter permease, partial [Terriglobia bacterium]|nr:ABC transporter permease [Terriglobia bacterium]
MSWRGQFAKLRGLFVRRLRGSPLERDLAEEIRAHLAMEEQENLEAGMPPEEAHYAALRRFGNVTLAQERSREMWGWQTIETLLQDLRYGLRQLGRSPAFTAVAVLTLGLGIGLNAGIFSLFEAATLRALPVEKPNTVVNVYQASQNDPSSYRPFSYPEYVALRDLNSVFSGLVAYSWIPVELDAGPASNGSGGAPMQAHGLIVSGNYFSVLGGEAALGRTFAADEGQIPGAYPVLVLSHALWQRQLNSDPSIVGRIVRVNGTPFTVIGIARQDFVGTEPQIPDFWAPLMMQNQLMPGNSMLQDRQSFWLTVVARLRAGVSRRGAQASMNVLISRLSRSYLGAGEKATVTLTPGSFLSRPDERGQADSLAFLIMAAVGMVLLIACANVASLVLARAAGRQREISIRLSLGASRRRLIQQLLTESALTALFGGGLGLLLAWRMPNLLVESLQPPYEQPISLHLALDIPILGYTLILSLLTGLIFGLTPALQASKPSLISGLKDEGTVFAQQLGRSRFRSLLVVAETAICLVLLLGAGLLVRALERAQTVNPGFDTKHVLVISLDLGFHGYDDSRAAVFHRQLTDRLQSLPGVKSVSVASLAPLGGVSRAGSIAVAGKDAPSSASPRLWDYWVVSSNYFETLGIPILQGRGFGAQDMRGERPVAIVNEAMARQLWPGENPLGKRFRLGPPSVAFTEVVGVAKDTHGARLWEADKPYVYLPLLLSTQGPPVQTEQLGMILLVRTEGNPDLVAGMVPRIVKALDPSVQPSCVVLEKSLGRWVWFSQVGAVLSGALGLLAVLLAVVGVYGVIAYSVTQRRREMGIRMALGASQKDVLKLIVGQGLRLVLFGVAIGLIVALVATRAIAAMLYG